MGFNLGKLGEQKVTVPIAVLIGLIWVGWNAKDFTVEGLDEFFMSEAQGEELGKKIDETNRLLVSYIARQDIKEINAEIRAIGDQITETQLWISANGANDIATARLTALVRRRDQLQDQKECLLNETITNKELCDVE